MAQLIVLESADPDRDIIMYINSPGGSFTALTAIYDTMQYIKPDIQTQAALIIDMKNRLAQITADQTGKSIEQVNADGDRDRWFTAEEALAYGFVDHIRSSAADVVGGAGTDAAKK